MRPKDSNKYQLIRDKINEFAVEYNYPPSRRQIAKLLNMSTSTLCRYINEMVMNGQIKSLGRSIITEIQPISIPVLKTMECADIFDKSNIKSHLLVSKGIFALDTKMVIIQAQDSSMFHAHIFAGNLLVFRKQDVAEIGQIVLALADNKYYVRRYSYDTEKNKAVLVAESPDTYPTMVDFQICAIVNSMITPF